MGSSLLPPAVPRSRVARAPRRPSGRALFWGMAFFLALQLALSIGMDTVHPEWRDPEFGNKLSYFRAACADNPGRPLVLVLGSSRPLLGFRPDVLSLGQPEQG